MTEKDAELPHAISGTYAVISNPTISFDGVRLSMSLAIHAPFIRMAYDARRGDAISAELLSKFRVTIEGYWPPECESVATVIAGGLR